MFNSKTNTNLLFFQLLLLFISVKCQDEILKGTPIFPNKETVLVGETTFSGKKVWDGKSLHTTASEPDDDVAPLMMKERLVELETEDVLMSNGYRYRTTVNSYDLSTLEQTSKNRGNENGETSCKKENCNGNIANEAISTSSGPDTTKEPVEARRLSILGADSRWENRGTPISWSPAKDTGLLTHSGGDCSAVLIAYKYILTAGHCVHEGSGGDYYDDFTFYPRRNSLDSSIGYKVVRVRTFVRWIDFSDWNHDLAMLELSVSPNIGYAAFGSNSNLGITDALYHKGYSNDKPFGSMWSTYDKIWSTTYYQLRTDDSDVTNGGNDGGPWYKYYSGNWPVIHAIQSGPGTYRIDNEFEIPYNRHTRITVGKVYSICDFTQCSGCCEIGGCIC